ncbi:MAG: hypothetical protein GDA43_14190 [Hormoscilla sp. SP5CHS1]|nr:hypothetical protein [Hormoscilla sp. SP12CHS1]MBC6454197.1 hypothetical protein [Hormoscilla sp. SP5CHS1]MBC6471840.1 hypothetical protein [Hormoscilla sp. GM102CHS1]
MYPITLAITLKWFLGADIIDLDVYPPPDLAIAFYMVDRGSRQITESVVLPGLTMSVLSEALGRTRTQSQSEVGAWLMTQFQQ